MTEVTWVGPVWRVTMYGLCLVMLLSGPGFLALGVLLEADVWAVILIALVLSAVLIPLGFAMWSDVRRTARGMRRLDAAGVEGTAEILEVTSTSHDEGARLELKLRISAPGVESFEAVHNRDGGEDLPVGSTLDAVVDPDGLYYAVG